MNPEELMIPPEYYKGDVNTEQYLAGHLPRFLYQIDLFERMIPGPVDLVWDLGTWVPFTSYYFYKKYNAQVQFGCQEAGPDINPRVKRIQMNLCDMIGKAHDQADVVIATEILEHLPCNVYAVLDTIAGMVRPGGHLLLSLPTGPIGKDIPYEKDLTAEYDPGVYHQHIREFPIAQAWRFFTRTSFAILEVRCIKTPLYQEGEGIMHVLLRKPK